MNFPFFLNKSRRGEIPPQQPPQSTFILFGWFGLKGRKKGLSELNTTLKKSEKTAFSSNKLENNNKIKSN